jgi:hypothetical protein
MIVLCRAPVPKGQQDPGLGGLPIDTYYCDEMGSRLDQLVALIVHEAAHGCVGGHGTTNISVAGGPKLPAPIRKDKCGRPDATNVHEMFINCTGIDAK